MSFSTRGTFAGIVLAKRDAGATLMRLHRGSVFNEGLVAIHHVALRQTDLSLPNTSTHWSLYLYERRCLALSFHVKYLYGQSESHGAKTAQNLRLLD